MGNIQKNKLIKLSNDEYFSYPALSNSFLIAFDISPCHAYLHKEQTKSQELGSYFHAGILEPEKLSEFLVAPSNNRNTNVYKDFKNNNPGKIIFLEKEMEENINDLNQIKHNLFQCEIEGFSFEEIYNRSQKEVVGIWSENDIKFKIKMDLHLETENLNIITELKSTTDALNFQKSVNNFQYYRQAYFYCNGATQINGKRSVFYHVPFEKQAPFGVKSYRLDDEYLRAGELATTRSIIKYLEWQKNGADKTIIYDKKTETLYAPSWIK